MMCLTLSHDVRFLNVRIGAAGALADGSIAVISAVPMAMALLGLLLALLAKFAVEAAAAGMALESVHLQ